MSNLNMQNDCCGGGVTLRTLLENRDIAAPSHANYNNKDDKEIVDAYCDATAAFLGPNLWEKTLSDFKLEHIDIDDIWENTVNNENQQMTVLERGIPNHEGAAHLNHLTPPHENSAAHMQGIPHSNQMPINRYSENVSPPSSPRIVATPSASTPDDIKSFNFPLDCKFSSTDLALATPPGHEHFDPTMSVFQEDDLKPQPMIKKSRKHFVPDDLKDDKYWARRRKNNMAAKRSREARRVKENQIVLRASYLEKENNTLKEDVLRLKAENDMLRNQLKKYKQ